MINFPFEGTAKLFSKVASHRGSSSTKAPGSAPPSLSVLSVLPITAGLVAVQVSPFGFMLRCPND